MVSVAAQGLSSASNLVVQAGLALTLAPAAFGSLVVGFSIYYFALALVRALVGDPLVALAGPESLADRGGDRRTDADCAVEVVWRRIRGRLVAIGALAAALIGAIAIGIGSVRAELAFLAAAVPILLTQDAYRYLAWARSRPGVVLVLDGVWVVSSLSLVLVTVLGSGASAVTARLILVAWCGGGIVSVLLARRLLSLPTRIGPRPSDNDRQTVGHPHDLARSLSWTQAILAVDANGLPIVVAALAGATVSGGLRAVTLPFMPVATVVVALRVLALPRLQAAANAGRGRLVAGRVALVFAAIGIGASAVTLGLLSFMPERWLGPSGRLVEPWFALGAVIVVGRLINLPLSDVLALGAARGRAMACRLGASILGWAATIGGALLFGLHGAITAWAGASIISIVVWAMAVVGATGPEEGELSSDESDQERSSGEASTPSPSGVGSEGGHTSARWHHS